MHLSVDACEEAMLAAGLPSGWTTGVAAYEVVRAAAELNLRLDRVVVVDAVNDSEEARDTWRRAVESTGAVLDLVHLVVGDEAEHVRRLAGRDRGFTHVGEPPWDAVVRRRDSYAPWAEPHLEIETGRAGVDGIVAEILARLEN